MRSDASAGMRVYSCSRLCMGAGTRAAFSCLQSTRSMDTCKCEHACKIVCVLVCMAVCIELCG
jgi:hypothetical protein